VHASILLAIAGEPSQLSGFRPIGSTLIGGPTSASAKIPISRLRFLRRRFIELLLSTDIRAAVPEARFGLPEVRWSIYPFGGATVKLAQQIGHVHAMDLLLTGRLVDAAFAERVGLVNAVVARDRLMPWAFESAAAIAANSPSAVQAVRTQISASIADYAKSREALEQQLGDRVRASPHFPEGVAAFREKRKPDYR